MRNPSSLLTALVLAFTAHTSAIAQEDDAVTTVEYDVREIVSRVPHAQLRNAPRGELRFRRHDDEAINLGGGGERELPNPVATIDELTDALASLSVEFGAITSKSIVVHAPKRAHANARARLGALALLAGRWAKIECLLIPPASLDRLAPDWRRAPRTVTAEVFEKAILDESAEYHILNARVAQRVATGAEIVVPLLSDHEVNQTGVIPVNNPVISEHSGGTRIEALALVTPDGERVLLEISVGLYEVIIENAAIGDFWSSLELPAVNETLFSTALLVEPGRVAVAGSLDGETWSTLLVRVRISGAGAPTPEAGIHDASSLLRARPRAFWPAHDGRARWPRGSLSFQAARAAESGELDADELAEALAAAFELDDGIRIERGVLGVAGRVDQQALRGFLTRVLEERSRSTRTELRILEVPRAVLAELSARADVSSVLEPGWESVLREGAGVFESRYSISGLTGEVNAVRHAKTRTFVVDVHQVSGGTGFAIVETSDPIGATCGDGIDLRARVELVRAGSRAQLQLHGELARIAEVRRVPARISAIDGSLGGGQAVKLQPREITLSLPRQELTEWSVVRDLPVDRDVILATDAAPGKKARVLVGRVTASE